VLNLHGAFGELRFDVEDEIAEGDRAFAVRHVNLADRRRQDRRPLPLGQEPDTG
jgi:hypothetical protein